MNTWYTTNQAAITSNALTTAAKVSSWAIIVDVKTKALALAGNTALSAYNAAIPRVTAD